MRSRTAAGSPAAMSSTPPGETPSMEIPGSPLSRHDIDVIWRQISLARLNGLTVTEVHVSAHRLLAEGLVLFGGLRVRARDLLALHEGLLIIEGRDPIAFDFEAEERL